MYMCENIKGHIWANGKDSALDISVVNPLQQELVRKVARDGESGVQHSFNIRMGKYSDRCAGSSGTKNFQSQDFRHGILQNPGIFRKGIGLKFLAGDFTKKKYGNGQISQIISFQMENFFVVILYLVYFALKYMYFENL